MKTAQINLFKILIQPSNEYTLEEALLFVSNARKFGDEQLVIDCCHDEAVHDECSVILFEDNLKRLAAVHGTNCLLEDVICILKETQETD